MSKDKMPKCCLDRVTQMGHGGYINEELYLEQEAYNRKIEMLDGVRPDAPVVVAMTILEEAQRLVHGDRGESYGHPKSDFERTGLIWEAVFGHPVTAEQVALCMIGVKISREVNKPKRDNRVDGAGYFETLDMVCQRRAENE